MEQVTAVGEKLVDEKTMASILGCSVRMLQEDRRTRRIAIPWIKLGRLARYKPSAALAYVEAHSAQQLEAA